MSQIGAPTTAREWKQNWTIVLAAAFGVGLAGTPSFTMGVFIAPLQDEFGWSRAAISASLMFHSVAAFFLGPVIGLGVDKWGSRRVGILGTFLMSCGFLFLSRIDGHLWMWWSVWLYLALAGVLVKHMVWTAAVTSVFTQSRGLALAVALCGTSIGSGVAPVLCGYLISEYDWRAAYVGLAGLFGLIVLPILFVFLSSALDRQRLAAKKGGSSVTTASHDTPQAPLLVGVSAMAGIKSWRFFRLSLAAITMVFVVTNLMINLVPILTSLDHPRLTAVGIAGTAGAATVVGRLLAGYLLDRMNGNLVAAVSSLLPIFACLLLLLLPQSIAAVTVAALIIGLSLGSEYDAVAYLLSRHFGTLSFGTLFGLLGGFLAAAAGIGPVVFSYSYDVTGTYIPGIITFMPLSIIASALFWSLGKYPVFDQRSL